MVNIAPENTYARTPKMLTWLHQLQTCCISLKKSRALFASVLLSILFAIIIPVLNASIIYPAFTEIIINSIEEDATKLGAHALPPSLKHSVLTSESLSQQFFADIYRLELVFGLLKITIFTPTGTVIYSTDNTDIGTTNTNPYFSEIIARGSSFSKLVTKESLSFEGQTIKTDVVETCIPIMSGTRFLGAFEMYYDVTKRKQQLDQLARYSTIAMVLLSACLIFMITVLIGKDASRVAAQEQADALREEVERITRHDMKSPLAGILNGVEYLEHFTQQTVEQTEVTAAIRAATILAMDMITRSLDLFKMETNRYEYTPTSIDLLATARQVTSDLTGLANAKGVTVVMTKNASPIHDGDTLLFMAEELLCYSLIANLLRNAIEASETGDIVTLALREDSSVRIVVHNAQAVPEPIRATFFDKYTTMDKPAGTGLGTYSAKLMTHTMGGTIEMTTSEQTGTQITVTLPSAAV